MASKLGDVRAQVNRAISTVGGLIDALAYLQDLLGATGFSANWKARRS